MAKTFSESARLLLVEAVQSVDPPTPATGFAIIYPKTDGNWYTINSSGTVVQLTSVANQAAINLFNYFNFI